MELSNHVPAHLQLLVRTEFEHLAVLEMTGQQIAYMLRLIAQERQVQQLQRFAIEPATLKII